jgi:hypothetical protein
MYACDECEFDLRGFAFGHIGLSRNYTDAKIKEKLRPALEELKAIGFIHESEYVSPRRGSWAIRIVKGKRARA